MPKHYDFLDSKCNGCHGKKPKLLLDIGDKIFAKY